MLSILLVISTVAELDAVVVDNNTKLLPDTPEGRLVMDAMDLSLHTLIDIYYPLGLADLTLSQ